MYKDLNKWRATKKKAAKKYYDKHSKNNTNRNRRYTAEEIEMIKNHEILDTELCKKLGRSLKAIQVKRVRLCKQEQLEKA